jgi:DNA repair protein RadA
MSGDEIKLTEVTTKGEEKPVVNLDKPVTVELPTEPEEKKGKYKGDDDTDLTQIRGIGPDTEKKLKEAGIMTITQLSTKRPDEILETIKVTRKAAKDMINDAKQKTLDRPDDNSGFLDEIKAQMKANLRRINTGSIAINKMFNGGLPSESIVVLSGEYASGKTQLCYQLTVETLKQNLMVVWMETEPGTFKPDRIEEIGKYSGLSTIDPKKVYVIRAKAINTPYDMYTQLERVVAIAERDHWNIGLLVIDSFSAKIRSFYSGREMLPDRSAETSRIIGLIETFASKFNSVIILTNQVSAVPDAGSQLHQIMKTGTRLDMVGGNVLKHSGTYICFMQKVKTDEWELIVADAPDVPFSSVRFKILASGIRDVNTRG